MSASAITTEFVPMPKTPRFFREIMVSEKIDGTNASVHISLASLAQMDGHLEGPFIAVSGGWVMRAASRTRWITPGDDNYGFAKWVVENKDELVKLGEGGHFGEWWGKDINRAYGLGHREFSLFNLSRWLKPEETLPGCVSLVPLLYRGDFLECKILSCLDRLARDGSVAKPGFLKPEGVCIFHTASRRVYKVTLENDDKPKSL